MTSHPATSDPPLILLSGMGADERVFAPQAAAFPNLTVPKWIEPKSGESLSSYAARFAKRIDPGQRCFIGGASFGGFVAIEMAKHLDTIACLLIGSVRSPDELPPHIKAMRHARPLARLLPFECVTLLAELSGGLSAGLSDESTRVMIDQAASADPKFLRWAVGALLDWDATPSPGCPVHHIHGDRDPVLPARYTHPDRLVKGGGHVLSLTHPDAVNDFLHEYFARYTAIAEKGP